MKFPKVKMALAAAALVTSAQAQAALTVYTTQAAFDAALAAMLPALSGTDTFDDLVAGADLGAGPLARSAGGIGYNASAGPTSNILFSAGSDSDAWLSTNGEGDTLRFDSFAPGVFAAGMNLFNSDGQQPDPGVGGSRARNLSDDACRHGGRGLRCLPSPIGTLLLSSVCLAMVVVAQLLGG